MTPSEDIVVSSSRLSMWSSSNGRIPNSFWDIYCEYIDIFNKLFGLSKIDCVSAGYTHSFVEAEWAAQGKAFYRSSILLPLRNAYYAANVTEKRWDSTFSKLELKTPLVDYGCGVGFMLVYLRRMGIEGRLMGWELPDTPQHSVMESMFKRYNIEVWDSTSHVETIICNHVLEHLDDPVSKVSMLRSMCNQLHADCEESEDAAHIAPMAIRRQVNDDLRQRGEHTSRQSL